MLKKQASSYFALDVILAWYFLLLALLIGLYYREIPHAGTLLPAYVSCAALVMIVDRTSRGLDRRKGLLLRCALGVIVIPGVFASLGFVLKHISPDDSHWQILSWDRWFFGFDHIRGMHHIEFPVLTDLLQLAYGSFYFLPLILLATLYYKKQYEKVELALTTIIFGFLVSYLLYFLLPVRSPNEILPNLWKKGWIVTEFLARNTREIEFLKSDCFPSGHTAMSLLTLLLAWRLDKKIFWIIYPACVGIWIATLYLGYHYVVDLVAGASYASIIFWLATKGFLVPIQSKSVANQSARDDNDPIYPRGDFDHVVS